MTEQPVAKPVRKIWGLDPNVFFLGVVSFLTDVSSEMIFTLVPLFLTNVLGVAATVVGLVGGLSDSTDAIFRAVSGRLSDRLGKRKWLAVLGYGISTLVKPLMFLAGSWGAITAIRFSDRVGKGIRSSPRDALLASSLSEKERGRGFGLHRAMDSAGAMIGLAGAALIIYLVQKGGIDITLQSYRTLVIFGTIPALLAILVLVGFVREKRIPAQQVDPPPAALLPVQGNGFDIRFKLFLAITVLFTLGNYSEFFVILRAQNLDTPVVLITVMLVTYNLTYALLSVPAGKLSDRLGRKKVITIGWGVYALAYLGFALAGASLWQIWLLFVVYGVYRGVFEGVSRAYVADLVPEGKRGTAYGLYQGLMGVTLLPASLIAGLLWDKVSPAAPFYYGAALAVIAMVGLVTLVKEPGA